MILANGHAKRVPIDTSLAAELESTRQSVSKKEALIDDVFSHSICKELTRTAPRLDK